MALCQFVRPKQQQCKRTIAEGEKLCWQHATGTRTRWRSLTRNDSVLFVIAALSLLATFMFGIYSLVHSTSASDRAYVSFSGFGNAIVNSSPTGKVWGYVFPMLWGNTGATTAHGKIQLGHRIATGDLPSGFDYPFDKPVSDFSAAPKGGLAWDYDFPVSDLQGIQQHTSRYFIWGALTYHDLAKSPMRLHEFCIEVVHVMTHYGGTDLTNPANLPVLKYDNCLGHNCDDENCSDYKRLAK